MVAALDHNSPRETVGQAAATDPSLANRVIKRRAPVACRRCRRMRSKCIHNGARSPCEGCRISGVSLEECIFPTRGTPDLDREYRHPRMKGDKARKEKAKLSHVLLMEGGSVVRGDGATDPWDLLPPLDHILEAVSMFTYQYFQVGFIPRNAFIQRIRQDPRSVSPFLLFSLLSVSGRLTDSLVAMHGDAETTAEVFMGYASSMALAELYEEPSLARCQAFYLLSLAQQGSGYRNKSYINLGIAIRMALLMQLHKEETYTLDEPSPQLVREAESARRTLWMLYSQDNLHASPSTPVSLAASDISALLPCSEHDFECGVVPKSRAALEDTPPAVENPSLVQAPNRSLFASLIQSHRLWGIISRRAVRNARCANPWVSTSEYAKIRKQLQDWETELPDEHRWSPTHFRESKVEAYDLAYLIIPMVTRLCNIVIRKTYLPDIIAFQKNKDGANESTSEDLVSFWNDMSIELFTNVNVLFTQIDVWFEGREPGDSTGAQMAIFCVYSCGLLSAYLCKYPHICLKFASRGRSMLERTLGILAQSKTIWPVARRWYGTLEKFSASDLENINAMPVNSEGSMAEGKDPIPSALHPPLTNTQSMPSASMTPLDDKQQMAKRLHSDGLCVRSFSFSGAWGSNNPATTRPPQLRTTDSLLNDRLRLPLPRPSPRLLTTTITAASHYLTDPHSQKISEKSPSKGSRWRHLSPPPPAGPSLPLSEMSLKLPPVTSTPLPQIRTSVQQLVIHAQTLQPQEHHMLSGSVAELVSAEKHMNLTPVSPNNAGPSPGVSAILGPGPITTQSSMPGNIDLFTRALVPNTSSVVPLAPPDMTNHSQLQNVLIHGVGISPPLFAGPANDGFESELEFMMAGSECITTTPWAPEFLKY